MIVANLRIKYGLPLKARGGIFFIVFWKPTGCTPQEAWIIYPKIIWQLRKLKQFLEKTTLPQKERDMSNEQHVSDSANETLSLLSMSSSSIHNIFPLSCLGLGQGSRNVFAYVRVSQKLTFILSFYGNIEESGLLWCLRQ